MFIGEGGSFLIPEVVREEKKGVPAGTEIEGKEAVGGIRFASRVLRPHETAVYVVTAGRTPVAEYPQYMFLSPPLFYSLPDGYHRF